MTYVLDASAVLQFLDHEAGAERIAEIIRGYNNGENRIVISTVNWGEIIGIFYKRHGIAQAEAQISRLRSMGLSLIAVTGHRAQRSARLKAKHKIPYIDSFIIELALDYPSHVVITADFDLKPAETFTTIEFLPAKQPQ